MGTSGRRQTIARAALIATAVLLQSPEARARAPSAVRLGGFDATLSAKDADDDATFVLLCSPDISHAKLVAHADARSLDHAYRQRRVLDAGDMVDIVDHDAASTTAKFAEPVTISCGRLRIDVAADMVNPNVYGHNGAFPAYGRVRVRVGGATVLPWLSLMACEGRLGAYAFGACPTRSAPSVEVKLMPSGASTLVAFSRNATAVQFDPDRPPFTQRECRQTIANGSQAEWPNEGRAAGLGPCPDIKKRTEVAARAKR